MEQNYLCTTPLGPYGAVAKHKGILQENACSHLELTNQHF